MGDKTQVLAFDREKRVYKDAYVDNFRKVRHFPALATIGAGRSNGESIILVQEPASASTSSSNTTPRRRALEDVPSRLLPPDSLEAMFERTAPLSSFRSAVLCKHTNARLGMGASPLSPMTNREAASGSSDNRSRDASRYTLQQAVVFKPPCAVEAKSMIERKVLYDPQAYSDKSPTGRSFTARDGVPQWSYSNAALAKEEIRTKKYFNVSPEGVVKADRKYTQEFIRKNVEAYQASRNQHSRER